jgi:hypothetical protein
MWAQTLPVLHRKYETSTIALLQLQLVKYFREKIHTVSNIVHVISNSVAQGL